MYSAHASLSCTPYNVYVELAFRSNDWSEEEKEEEEQSERNREKERQTEGGGGRNR